MLTPQSDVNPNLHKMALGLMLVAFVWLILRWGWQPEPPQFITTVSTNPFSTQEKPMMRSQFASHRVTPMVHSATAIETKSGKLMSFWYGGQREGSKDVAIYKSNFDPNLNTWSQETVVITRATLQKSEIRYIKKLGNPVVGRAPGGRLWLFFVSVSIGGWSGSTINLAWSDDEAQSWHSVQKLIESPFFNFSSLVRTPPLFFQDGSVGLAIYHEIMGKFGEFLFIDEQGNVTNKARMSWGRDAIQPMVIPSSTTHAANFMRNSGDGARKVWRSETKNSAQSWSTPEQIDLPNPNSAVAGLRLSNADILLALNNSPDERDDMSLVLSKDNGKTWRTLYAFEQEKSTPGGHEHEFSYPCLIQTKDGNYHLFYTWYKTHIKHIQFNQAWLNQH